MSVAATANVAPSHSFMGGLRAGCGRVRQAASSKFALAPVICGAKFWMMAGLGSISRMSDFRQEYAGPSTARMRSQKMIWPVRSPGLAEEAKDADTMNRGLQRLTSASTLRAISSSWSNPPTDAVTCGSEAEVKNLMPSSRSDCLKRPSLRNPAISRLMAATIAIIGTSPGENRLSASWSPRRNGAFASRAPRNPQHSPQALSRSRIICLAPAGNE